MINFSLYSQVVQLERNLKGKVVVDITRIESGGLDIFTMYMPVRKSQGRVFKLLCSFNPFYHLYRNSGLVHTNDTIYRGEFYQFDDGECLKLFNFFKDNFEYINEDNALQMTLNLEKRTIELIRFRDSEDSRLPAIEIN